MPSDPQQATSATPASAERLKGQMFALSFTALFLEMMVIRWVPSVVKLIAFYANLMLLSSFLGLGIGALTAGRDKKGRLFDFFPVLLALEIGLLYLCRGVVFSTSASEIRMSDLQATLGNHFILIAIFGVNALLFVPLGQRMGAIFDSLPRLSAYAWDLGGSLAGTLCFGIFSLLHFSPVWGLAGVMAVYLVLSRGRRWPFSLALFAAILAMVQFSSDPKAIWSPYHYITISRMDAPGITVSEPEPNLTTMKDPPVYSVSVHHFYYHYDLTLDPERYTPGTRLAGEVADMSQYFRFPYEIAKGRDRVLVLGAGGGGDVLGALASGAKHVDAVEIDPVVVQISRRFNAAQPYSEPRVAVHVDDARSFLSKADKGYDLVVYGLLDSHALFSSMNNVRLDGYVYTVEGIRRAYDLLRDDGMLALAFYLPKDWLLPKFNRLVAEATGREPAMYLSNRTLFLCVPKTPARKLPPKVFQFQRIVLDQAPTGVEVPTDDWPFLYLREKTIPSDYLIAIASLLALSVGALVALRRGVFGGSDLHFALLGMGFLLLETKSITDCSLYFGATWLVTVIVVSGVLLMVMASNLVAGRLKTFSPWYYLPLILSLAALLLVPREAVLGFGLVGRLAWSMLAVPLPVFFAGIVFSTTFREAPLPSSAFGSNLIGAMVGGFCEYLAMAIGSWRLSALIVAAYLLSLLTQLARRRRC